MSDVDQEIFERTILLKKSFSIPRLIEIGKNLELHFFLKLTNNWRLDLDRIAFELSSSIDNTQLEEIFKNYQPWSWSQFRGSIYSYDSRGLKIEGVWKYMQVKLQEIINKYGESSKKIINLISSSTTGFSLETIKKQMPKRLRSFNISGLIEELLNIGLLVETYRGDNYVEWGVPEEIVPYVLAEVRDERPIYPRIKIDKQSQDSPKTSKSADDYLLDEFKRINEMDAEFDSYLQNLLKDRLEDTIKIGKSFSIQTLENYLIEMFGHTLYFDSFLAITQQYGIADVPVISEFKDNSLGLKTGFNLALFGEPGTGKSYSTRDMILGKSDGSIPAHGLPGKNRYAAGITPARFIRIGQAYAGKSWNFIIPEFNEWFRTEGMVEILKLAMERGEIRYELHREIVGPYFFSSFFSVNYNTQVFDKGYRSTVKDPNFQAIEDRMICRLHRLTKHRYAEIAQSRMKMMLGESEFGEFPEQIRDHLSLLYAIETAHPLVKDRFKAKSPLITKKMMMNIRKTREMIFDLLPAESVPFSARLEDRSIRLACALSLMEYFNSNQEFIPISRDAQMYASRFYIEEAAARASLRIDVQEILNKLNI
jgi:hypothetical protein